MAYLYWLPLTVILLTFLVGTVMHRRTRRLERLGLRVPLVHFTTRGAAHEIRTANRFRKCTRGVYALAAYLAALPKPVIWFLTLLPPRRLADSVKIIAPFRQHFAQPRPYGLISAWRVIRRHFHSPYREMHYRRRVDARSPSGWKYFVVLRPARQSNEDVVLLAEIVLWVYAASLFGAWWALPR